MDRVKRTASPYATLAGKALFLPLFLLTPQGFAEPLSLPVFFVPNSEQSQSGIAYLVQTPELRAGFSNDGAVFQIESAQVRVHFVGANDNTRVTGTKPLKGRANFLTGPTAEEWRTGVPMFGQLHYRNLYPGIDATYEGSSGRLKSEFQVSPGADPRIIRLAYEGAESRDIDANGDLVIHAGDVTLRELAPVAYQDLPGRRAGIAVAYRLQEDGTVGFEIGDYDPRYPLVIDPIVTYSTYLGGSGSGAVTAVAVDASGNLYAAGWTESLNFPIAGAFQAASGGGVDAFVVKLNATGTSPLYATYVGGSGEDRAYGIAVDSAGQAYIGGATASFNFPLAAPARALFQGGREGFLVKLTAIGNGLGFSTFVGGSSYDVVTAVARGPSGHIYAAGDTQSADLSIVNGVQTANGGKMDAFVFKFTDQGQIAFSTYLGGSNNEHAGGIAIDGSGNALVAGGTDSFNFPTLGALQGSPVGQDAYVTKIKTAAPTGWLYSTFLGGDGGSSVSPEQANAIAVDADGNAYVAGSTNSNNFPVTTGALKTAMGGTRDAFVTKINAAGTQRIYSTYLGGISFDWASAIAVDATGNAHVAGYTSSLDFTSVAAVQPAFNGFYDAFVAELNAAGNGVIFSTPFGGAGADQANAIALDSAGNIFLGGQTGSYNFATLNALQSVNAGGNTGWVSRMGVAPPPLAPPSADSASVVLSSGLLTITAVFSHPQGAANLTNASVLVGNSPAADFSCYVTYLPASNTFQLAKNLASSGSLVVSPGGGNVSNDQCTLQGSGSSVVVSGNTMTIIVRLALAAGYPGPGTNAVYLYASDTAANTGWVAKGGLPGPRVDSVSPAAATGSAQEFTFVFSDNQSASNLTGLAMMFHTSVNAAGGCYLVFDKAANTVSLLYDSGAGSSSRTLTSLTPISNSQCSVGATSVVASGQMLSFTAAITFKPAFNGTKNIYMYAASASQNTGWQQKGTYAVVAGRQPTVSGTSPTNSGGSSGILTFTVSDPGGSSYISGIGILFSTSSSSTANACYLNYDRAANRVTLAYDSGAGSSPVTLGTTSSVANSQCTLNGSGSSVSVGANTVSLTLNLGFSGSFTGVKNIYVLAAEVGMTSGWVQSGTWTVTAVTPTADSVTPSAGSGLGQTFVTTVSDPVSGNNLTRVSLLVSAAGTANACYVYYERATNLIHLYNDSGTWTASKPAGSSAALQNSQCAVGYVSRSFLGNSMTVNIYLLFKQPGFSGPKTVSLQAHTAAATSGWVTRGTWTVP